LLSGRDPSTFLSTRSANFAAADSSSQIALTEFIININYHLHRQDLQGFIFKNRRVHPNRWITGQVEKSICSEIQDQRHQDCYHVEATFFLACSNQYPDQF
jgi:hypothetical protein